MDALTDWQTLIGMLSVSLRQLFRHGTLESNTVTAACCVVDEILLEEQEKCIMFWVFVFHCRFYLVFEKVNGGPLLTRLQEQIHFTEREASQIIRDLASALQFLHVKGEFIRLRLCFMASCGGIWRPTG